MIRPFTCICMLLAAGAGLYLYQTKHRAQLLDREIARTYKQIEQTKERIGMLKGEWALLNEPERLAELARQHLTLRTLAPTQFVALADLGNHLPAPLPPGTFVVPAPDDTLAPAAMTPAPIPPAPIPPASVSPAPVPIAAAKPLPAAIPAKAPPAPILPNPVQLAAVPPAAAPSPPTPHQPPRPPATTPVTAAPATVPPPSAPHSVPRIMAPIVNVSASPVAAPHPAAPTPAAPTPAAPSRYTAAPIAPSFAPSFPSALGSAGHVALPAPVPYATSASR